jgi:nitrogen fixation protein NifX
MPFRMIVAFATSDLRHVDAQFADARHLALYEVTAAAAVLQGVFTFEPAEGEARGSRHRFQHRALALRGCPLVFVSAAGPSLVARLAACGVSVATARGATLDDLLAEVSALLARDAAQADGWDAATARGCAPAAP